MDTNNSLPDGYEKLKQQKPYVRITKLPPGEHRYRIVQPAIGGWVDWKDSKPYRFKVDQKPKLPFSPEKPIQAFWAVHVWDYAQEGLYVMEIVQSSIKGALENLALSADWGNLTGFDFKIKKELIGGKTKYSVIPVPHKPMSKEIVEALSLTKVRLEALYEGKDPWTDLEETFVFSADTGEIIALQINESEIDVLEGLSMQVENTYTDKIKKMFKIDSLRDVPKKEYDRTVRHFNNIINNQENSRGSATMA